MLFLFIIKKLFYCLNSTGLSLDTLRKVRTHITLEVKVSEDIRLLDLEKRRELNIWINGASVILVLKLIRSDVCVNLTSNLRASHLGSNILSKEGCQLITDTGGLNKPRRLADSSLSLAARILLLGCLKLTRPLLLKSAVFSLMKSKDQVVEAWQ